MENKSGPAVAIKITDESKGEVEAVFSTLNAVDKDGDVTLPGAFGDQNVRISAFNHTSWNGELPIGKGSIRETGKEAILNGRFFLDTQKGRDTFVTIKELGELMEWSYGYDILERSEGVWPVDDPNGKQVQFLKKLKVHEVSPVILGAGVDTRTLSAKGANKGAIPYSETGTTDVNWDVGLMRRRITPTRAALRAASAWVDVQGDENAKGSYKFLHHMVSENGSVGAANTRACTAAIAILNGGRGGSTIPEGDRQGVYTHVAHHIRDAGGEAPPLKSREEYEAALKEWFEKELSEDDLKNVQEALGQMTAACNGDTPPTGEALKHLMAPLDDLFSSSGEPTLDFEGGVKLFSHAAWASEQLEVLTNRVVEAVAIRGEKGETLAEPTVDMVKSVLSTCDRLREALAIQPRNNPNQQKLVEQIFRDSRSLLYLTGGYSDEN